MGASWPTVLLLFSVFAALHGYSLKPFGEPAEKKSNLRFTSSRSNSTRSQTGRHVPRSGLLISGRGFGPGFGADTLTSRYFVRKRGLGAQNKRAVDKQKFVPRSGLMISGRGFMPGFVDSRDFSGFYRRRRDLPQPLTPLGIVIDDGDVPSADY
ncbi:hypothetical protein PRIPAC_75066 [Pristionchus pacificus]|uniref:Uncharacterized protein n=1 Tax=Pristionchus pacificus TaxID=54126 RepID=A0A2A6B4E4_PRIPA|nr:hypothetical protein PRIPAC_75066 [Pristionchus pacificus]|eukprot:PDM60755.1 hypothetical protein PRIPAC_54561 [Pristionchus pacificus]